MSPDLFGDMAVDTSAYQAFKIWLGGRVPLSRNAMHVLLGSGLLVLMLTLRPRHRAPVRAFTVALILGLLMEALDRRDDIASLGAWRLWESLLDVARTVALPLGSWLLVHGWTQWRRAA